ncbi:MAG: 2-oxoacid:acceptor oxidoreductase family protein [Promethearchaeota archaeon]
MIYNIFLCGIGGQGVVLFGRFLRLFLFNKFKNSTVTGTESRGVSQREGSVISTVRIKFSKQDQSKNTYESEIIGPEIPYHEADVIIALEPIELLRNLNFAHKQTLILVNRSPIIPKNVILERKRQIKEFKAEKRGSREEKNGNKEIDSFSPVQIIEKACKILENLPVKDHSDKGEQFEEYSRSKIPNEIPEKINGNFPDKFESFKKNNRKLKIFSTYLKLVDLDLTSFLLDQFETASSLNFVMLGILSTFLKKMLPFTELNSFIEEYFGKNKKGNNMVKKNEDALLFGKFLRLKLIETILEADADN